MQVSEVFLCVAIAVIARVQSQFLYEGGLVENHGLVDRYDMANNARRLRCVTAVSSCCRDSSQGTWFRPDGVPVTSSAVNGVHQVYGNRRIELVVTSRSAMSGIYRCTIQTNDQSSELESYHVGLYPPNEGNATVQISLTVNREGPRYTLNCVTIGGPIGRVDWRQTPLGQTSQSLGEGNKVLNNPVTAQYNLTKSVNTPSGRIVCSIISPHSASEDIKFDDNLGDMSVSQSGISQVRVRWDEARPNIFTASHMNYQKLGTNQIYTRTINWRERTAELSGLTRGADYSIYLTHVASLPNTVKAATTFHIESTSISITSSHTFPVTIGDEVTLTCRVVIPSGISGNLDLEWHQPNGTYRYAPVYGIVGGRMVYDELRLGHITQSNVGEYSCTASLNGAVSSTITIPNLNLPSPTVAIEQSRSDTLYAGTDISLTCTATLTESLRYLGLSVHISWSGPQTFISSTMEGSNGVYTKRLSISPLAISDSGTYICAATVSGTNVYSITSRQSRVVSVTDLPPPTVVISEVGERTAGEELQLTCTVTVVENLVTSPCIRWTGGSLRNSAECGTPVNETTSTKTITFSPLFTSHGARYTCEAVIRISSIGLDTTTTSSTSVTVLIPRSHMTVVATENEVVSDSSVSLTCSVHKSPYVDTPTSTLFLWITPNSTHDRSREVNDTNQDLLTIPSAETTDTGFYICNAAILDSSGSGFIIDSKTPSAYVRIRVKPNAVISTIYTPVPEENPEKMGANEFTAGSVLILSCTVEGSVDQYNQYKWSTTGSASLGCTECNNSILIVGGPPLYSGYAGNYTCTVNDTLISRPFTVSVIGARMYGRKRQSSSGLEAGSLIANNGMIISGREGLRLECVSNSSQSGLGTVTTPAGHTLSPGDTKQGWSISPPPHTPGLLSLITSAPITPSQQGIYTCSLPDSNGNDIELNVGIYLYGFYESPRIKVHYLNYKDSCGHVKCVSSGSPATSVTWMKDGQPLNTDRSSNYTFSQEISDREDSVYTNVLVVSRMTTGNYTCTVTNDLGSTSMDIIVDSECEADSFTAEAGERQVTFSWCPPDDSNCTTHTLFFNISCYPPPSSPSSPLLISEPGTTTLDGFSPNTEYNCSIHTQSHYTVSFTTKEDYSQLRISIFLDRKDSNNSCSQIMVRSKEKILQMVTDLVVEQLQKICSECDSANIDREEIECTDQSPPTITYRARLGGTHANDSDDLVAELEKWAGEGQHLSLNDEPDSPESMELVGVAAGVSAGLISLVATMGAFLAVWRSRRSVRETKQAQELGMEELPRPERAPDELKETERDYSYVTVERNESTERKSVAIDTDGNGNNSPIITPHYNKLGTITTDVAVTTPRGAEDGVNSGSPRDGSPTIDTRGNTAYLPVAPRDGRDRQYVEMPSRQKPEPQPSAGRRLPLTGITTTPNAAYFEISVDSLQYSATLPSRPMDPLYESVGDFTLWKDRAKRGVQQLLKSLPRYAAPQANNKPPHLPPSHPSRSQSLPRGNVAPPTAKEAPPTTKEAPPDPEDSPMRNRPPAPLPEEARESDEDDDDYVYERVVNND